MPHYPKLTGFLCYLSPCSMEDAEKWVQWDTDLTLAIPLGDEAYTPTSLGKAREILTDVLNNQEHVFSILDTGNDEVIGRGMLFDVDHLNRKAMLGVVIGEKQYWGKGYGEDATHLLVEYGFDILNLNSIMLGVFEFNQRAIRCYEKVGFKPIGRRRQARLIAGRWYDAILMDILAEEVESRHMRKIMTALGV